MSTLSDLDLLFAEACNYFADHVLSIPDDEALYSYGFYKQATVGPCTTPKPTIFEMRARMMWKSWSQLGSMSKDEAKRGYIELLDRVASNWRSSISKSDDRSATSSQSWVRVSSPNQEEPIADSAKDIFDWVKEGDLQKVRQLSRLVAVNARDDCGLSLLHWAADRGHLDIVRYLISELKADVNCLDNERQTPLHYAAACGYLDVCKFLVDSQAQVAAKDCEGLAPIDVAEEASVKELLGALKIV